MEDGMVIIIILHTIPTKHKLLVCH